MTSADPGEFRMHGAREAVALGLGHVEEQIEAVEAAVLTQPGLAFDLARTLIESTCRSVLSDLGVTYENTDELPKLFKVASQQVSFLPPAASSEADVRESLKKTLSGLNTAVQGICELRNSIGFASHGSDGQRPRLDSAQALLAAQAADTIVGFLYRAHTQDRTPPPTPRMEYEENAEFNAYVDDLHEIVSIFEGIYQPSDVLFFVDRDAYRDALANFVPAANDVDGDGDMP